MKIKTLSCVMGMLLPLLSVNAQEIKPLKIGDTLPDLVLHNVINYKDSVIRLSDFKDKLVILDFWATYCTPCISHFPQLYQLEAKYGNRLKVILASEDAAVRGRDYVWQFLEMRKPDYILTCTMDGLGLKAWFPHTGIPFYVWIKGGKVAAITGADAISERNVRRILDSANFPSASMNEISLGQIPVPKIDPDRQPGRPKPEHYPYSYWHKGLLPGLQRGKDCRRRDSGIVSLHFSNCPAEEIIESLYADTLQGIPVNRITWAFPPLTRGPELFQKDSLYNIGFVVHSPLSDDSVYTYARHVLESRYGGRPFRIIKRKTKCLVIGYGRISVPALSTAPGFPGTNIWESGTTHKFYQHLALDNLIYFLNLRGRIPVLDETNLGDTKVTLSLPDDPLNTDALITSLNAQKFHARYEWRYLSFLQIIVQP